MDGLTYLCSTHPGLENDMLYSYFAGLHTLRAFLVLSSRQGEELAGERLYVSFDSVFSMDWIYLWIGLDIQNSI